MSPMSISAAVTEGRGSPFAVQDVELGELRADGILVNVSAAAICHTDLVIKPVLRMG